MSITLFIILITSSISIYGMKNSHIAQKLIFYPYMIYRRKEFYRFISYGLLHADFTHLVFNMFALYSFGENLESIYQYYFGTSARLYFIILYVGGLIISNIPSFLQNKNNPNYVSLGASGAVFSIIFSTILYSPTSPICLFGVICMPSIVFGCIYILYAIYLTKNNLQTLTNHKAHIVGALFGIIFNIIIMPKVIPFFLYQIKNLNLL